MKIRELYKAILAAVGAVVNDDGLISMTRPGDDPVPVMVKDKRLAMPTEQLLNQGAFNPDGSLMAFHPICENVVLETSPVLEKLETMMIFRLTWVMRELIMQLVSVAADPKQHKKLKMRAHGLLSALPEADERTKQDFIKIAEHTTAIGAKKLLTLYVRQGGMYDGEKVSRLARFFPSIVDSLDEEKRTLHGVNLRKADVPAFLALIEYIVPDYRDADRYASPSNALVAPTFHSLVKTYFKVANQLNKVVDLHAGQLEDADSLRIPTDWIEAVQDLNDYREMIPVLPGNDGEQGTKTVKLPPAKAMGAQAAAAAAAAAAAKPKKTTGKGVSVDDFIRKVTPPRPTFGAYGQQAVVPVQPQQQSGWGGRQAQQAAEDLPPWARDGATTSTWGNRPTGNAGWSGGRQGGGGRL